MGQFYGILTPTQALSMFPVLQEYSGAYQNLHIFVQRATLTHITLSNDLLFCNFVTELQGTTILPKIISLTVRFAIIVDAAFDKAEVDDLFTLFPNLAELQLTLVFYPHPEEDESVWQVRMSRSHFCFLDLIKSIHSRPPNAPLRAPTQRLAVPVSALGLSIHQG
ncbi:hypothetical protein C8R45DRAFT_1098354 [Mycena sanguinolenta]|nr:hypothetical protein C8R45DRAFT_1098354 [Mycena sanguinolenta]